jgi:small-conductance mechanosensitive channel
MATRKFKVGDRVEGGKGEDHDMGRIVSIDWKTKVAVVAWDSLVMTPAPLDILRLVR